MIASSVASEAWRNISSGTTGAILLAITFFVGTSVLATADALSIVQANREVAQWQDSGASVYVLYAEDGIDGDNCDHLADGESVRAAGAIRSVDGGLMLSALPAAPPPLWEVTSGFSQLVSTSARGATTSAVGLESKGGILVSEDLATVLGIDSGASLPTSHGDARVAGVFAVPDDGRDQGLSYSALAEVTPHAPFDACWVDVWPPSLAVVDALPSVLRANAPADQTVFLNQYNATLGTTLDMEALFDNRLTRFAPGAAALLGLSLGFLAIRGRRLELTSSLHAGVSRRALRGQLFIESMTWAIAGSILCFVPIVLISITKNPYPPATAIGVGALVVASTFLGVAIGSSGAISTTREEHLFRYFKNRT